MTDYTHEIPWWRDESLKERDLAEVGGDLLENWMTTAGRKAPDGIIEKVSYYAGLMAQLIISVFTFPIGLAGFMIEESLQAWGFAAFILWQAEDYQGVMDHVKIWKEQIDAARGIRDSIGAFSPIIFSAVTNFIKSSRYQAESMNAAALLKYVEKERYEEDRLQKAQEKANTMILRLVSSPADAEIWIDGENTGLLTPETLEFTSSGIRTITIRKYDRQEEGWRIYSFTQPYRPGKRIEKSIPLPTDIEGEGPEGDSSEETVEDFAPEFVFSEVEGDIAIDGDTFKTVTGEKVRLIGIDAPEKGRPYGSEATDYLQQAIEDKQLRLKIQSHKVMDSYNRILAEVRNYKGNINVALLSNGYAKQLWDKNDYFDRSRYETAEKTAQERKIGIWTDL